MRASRDWCWPSGVGIPPSPKPRSTRLTQHGRGCAIAANTQTRCLTRWIVNDSSQEHVPLSRGCAGNNTCTFSLLLLLSQAAKAHAASQRLAKRLGIAVAASGLSRLLFGWAEQPRWDLQEETSVRPCPHSARDHCCLGRGHRHGNR